MDNFKRPNRKPSRQPGLVDGFLPVKPSGTTRPATKQSEQPGRLLPGSSSGRRLDDFSRRSSVGASSARPNRQVNIPDGSSLGRRRANEPTPAKRQTHNAPKRSALKTAGQVFMKGMSVLLVLVLIGSGILFGKGYLRAQQIFKGGGAKALALNEGIDPNSLKGEGDGRINILLLGKGGPGHDGPDLTDTLIIASIDPLQKDAALLSIPRDLWIQPDGSSGGMKINALYATTKQNALYRRQSPEAAEKAGIKAIEKEMTQVTGLPIHYYTMVDFEAFREAIDTVGGITVNAPEQLYDPTVAWENNWNPVIARAGVQQMNGKQALLYARSRHGSARGDFDRAERQRLVILALREKAFSLGTFSNPLKVAQLIDAFGTHVQTDISLDDMKQMMNLAKSIDASKVKSLGLADPPNDFLTTGAYAGVSIVRPKAGLFEYGDIQAYIRTTIKDGFIRKENPRVVILNGTTTPGLATQKADVLKSYGYNVVTVDSAPTTDYEKTMFVDLTKGVKKYTKRYMELRYKTSATTKLPSSITTIAPGSADFVIILGSNETYSN